MFTKFYSRFVKISRIPLLDKKKLIEVGGRGGPMLRIFSCGVSRLSTPLL
jgi:hypothetical protein